MERTLRAWQTGTARWVDDWDRPVEAVRGDFASIIGATGSRCRPDGSAISTASAGGPGPSGHKVFIDATHALPFVPVAPHIADIDFLVCHAYKHMLGARGTAFLYVRPDRLDDLMPSYANRHGAPDPWTRFFGGPLTLADGASRFDLSLAWLPWAATVESVRLIATWCRDGTLAEPLELAARLATSLGQEPTGSSLVCVPIADPDPVRASLDVAGIRAAVRGDAIRFSLHVWNDAADVDRAVEAIGPFL